MLQWRNSTDKIFSYFSDEIIYRLQLRNIFEILNKLDIFFNQQFDLFSKNFNQRFRDFWPLSFNYNYLEQNQRNAYQRKGLTTQSIYSKNQWLTETHSVKQEFSKVIKLYTNHYYFKCVQRVRCKSTKL